MLKADGGNLGALFLGSPSLETSEQALKTWEALTFSEERKLTLLGQIETHVFAYFLTPETILLFSSIFYRCLQFDLKH